MRDGAKDDGDENEDADQERLANDKIAPEYIHCVLNYIVLRHDSGHLDNYDKTA
jgi:hypothetical protein